MLAPDRYGAILMPAFVIRRLLPLLLAMAQGFSLAASAEERAEFSLILKQLDTVDVLARRAEASSAAGANERYRFDYPRLTQDIQRIRQGVQGYLSPSRSQPRDPGALIGDYLLDTPLSEVSP
jgi:RAQPRD family integrative conjugative element protein